LGLNVMAGESDERPSRPRSMCSVFAKAFLALLAFTLLTACTQTTAFEPQNQPLDTHQARLYFIRQPAILSKIGGAEIRIDGKVVGSLATGTYIVADRPRGSHKITVAALLDSVATQAEINVQPGIPYYFELGPVVRTNLDAFQYESMGVTGQLVPSRPGPNSPFTFFSLDATAGAASVARIRIRNS